VRRKKAAAAYARFADSWKNADPELQPRVQAARARIAQLLPDRGDWDISGAKEAAMGAKVGVNKLSVVQRSDGGVVAVVPDVCKVPAPPAPFVPIAYPSTAPPLPTGMTVKTKPSNTAAVGSKISRSLGDEAGTQKGIASSNQGIAMMNELQTMGFTKAGATLLVQGLPVELEKDQMLLYSILTRNAKQANVTASTTSTPVKRKGIP